LLVPEVAWPFWMMVGVLAGLAPPPGRTAWQRPLVIAACVVVAISVPFRASALRAQADLEYQGVGLSSCPATGDARFREAGATFAMYLPTDRPSIVPLRRAGNSPDPLSIQVKVAGEVIATVTLSGVDWHAVTLQPPDRGRWFERVDFAATATG